MRTKFEDTKEREVVLQCMQESAKKLSESVGAALFLHLMDQTKKLTDSELLNLTSDGYQAPRCCRTLFMATGLDFLESQFNCEAIKTEVRRAKGWLKYRY